MSLFTKQPGFCPVCGAAGEYRFSPTFQSPSTVCSDSCRDEWNWRWTLSTMGKAYYIKPSDVSDGAVDP